MMVTSGMKISSPGILLIAAVVAACGIFLLDNFYLRPQVAKQEAAALQDQANKTRSTVMWAMGAQQTNLLRACAAWGKVVETRRLLAATGGTKEFALQAQRLAEIDLAWVTDAEGRIVQAWSRDPHTQPPKAPSPVTKDAQKGLIELDHELLIFARHNLPAADKNAKSPGQLWLGRFVRSEVMEQLAAGGKLVFIDEDKLPTATGIAHTADQGHSMTEPGQLAVVWLVRDPTGKALGYLRTDLTVRHIHLQATHARRTALIILSLSIALALLVIVGAHMLVTGPVIRLLRRLQHVDSLGAGSKEQREALTRGLRGESLVLAQKLQSAFAELAHISKTDQLTGLANRRHFHEVMAAFFNQARRYDRPLSLIILDVDFFKAINDTGGHHAGDELLRTIAQACRQACRLADLPGRIGGDEFAILLPETSAKDAEAVAQRLRQLVGAHAITVNSAEFNMTLSIGITDLSVEGINSREDMINLADQALYAAKERGRNRVVHASELKGTSLKVPSTAPGRNVLNKKLAGLDNRFKELFLQAVHEIVDLLEQRDPHMADHARKVGHYAPLIARKMNLPKQSIKRIEIAATLHDIGMLSLPDSILLCPTELNEEQLRLMQEHTLRSVRIMQGMEFLEQEIPAVRHHHERFDGTGYPDGLAGGAIPLAARILAVADAFDAMLSPRTFRSAKTIEEALAEIQEAAGSQFDPAIVTAFVDAAVESSNLPESSPSATQADPTHQA